MEKFRPKRKPKLEEALRNDPSRGRRITEVFKESPNGYEIVGKAPPPGDLRATIDYYTDLLTQYTIDYPEENGIIHFYLGNGYLGEMEMTLATKNPDLKSKYLENAVYHLRMASEVLTQDSHPIMNAVSSVLQAHLFRLRSTMITNRSFLGRGRGTAEESIQQGLDTVLEPTNELYVSEPHCLEYSFCCYETGYLYFLKTEYCKSKEDDFITRELAVTNLDRALSILGALRRREMQSYHRTFNYKEFDTYPEYIQNMLLLPKAADGGTSRKGRGGPGDTPSRPSTATQSIGSLGMKGLPLRHIEGMIMYLLGRVYQDWNSSTQDQYFEHQKEAYNWLTKALQPAHLLSDCEEWGDARHRVASIIIRFPRVVDPDFGINSSSSSAAAAESSDLHMELAVSHLKQAIKCPAIPKTKLMDVHFHLAQCLLARLQLVMDKVPQGESLMKALEASDNQDLLPAAKHHLTEAKARCTAASTQSTQDAYVFYFATLKLAELGMLEAGSRLDITANDREALLRDCILQLVEAQNTRSLAENCDLQYIAIGQMAQMLAAARKLFAAARAYAKVQIALGYEANRIPLTVLKDNAHIGFPAASTIQPHRKVLDETLRQQTQALFLSARGTQWTKRHLGPVQVTQSVSSGYASWSFEEDEERPIDDAAVQISGAKVSAGKATKQPAPPVLPNEGLVPKFAAAVGTTPVPANHKLPPSLAPTQVDQIRTIAAPPSGAVPLSAMKHKPDLAVLKELAEKGLYVTPYRNRRRKRVPLTEDYLFFRTAEEAYLATAQMTKPIMPGSNPNIDYSAFSDPRKDPKPPKDASNGAHKQQTPTKSKTDKSTTGEKRESVDATVTHRKTRGFVLNFTQRIGEKYFKWSLSGTTQSTATTTSSATATPGGGARKNLQSTNHDFNSGKQPKAEMWASIHSYYMFMTLSRSSRIQLVLKGGNQFLGLKGERAKTIFRLLSSETRTIYKRLTNEIKSLCREQMILPPFTLKELSQRPFSDMQALFNSQSRLHRLFAQLEQLFIEDISTVDLFLCMLHICPTLSRDFLPLDKTLLDPRRLIDSLAVEDAIHVERSRLHKLGQTTKQQSKPTQNSLDSNFGDSEAYYRLRTKNATVAAEMAEETQSGAMSHFLSQVLDGSGTQGGARDMLERTIDLDECLLVFHMPSSSSQSIQVLLVWREDSASTSNSALPDSIEQSRRKERARSGSAVAAPTGIVMESAKCDLDAGQMLTWLDALHSRPNPRRLSQSTDVLWSLSCALSLTELLLMVPPHVTSLCICCPPAMRLIPWHLLHIEIPSAEAKELKFADGVPIVNPFAANRKTDQEASTNDSENGNNNNQSNESDGNTLVQIHLIEKYSVRLGPTLSLYELCSTYNARLPHSPGSYRMCALDGEEIGKNSSPGNRSTQLEIACATSTWSGDPGDYSIRMGGDSVCPRMCKTSGASKRERSEAIRRKENRRLAKKKLAEDKKKGNISKGNKIKRRTSDRSDSDSNDSSNSSESESDEMSDSSEEEGAQETRKQLASCRVLHFSASKVAPYEPPTKLGGTNAFTTAGNSRSETGLSLPVEANKQAGHDANLKSNFTTSDVMANLYLRNCSLAVLPRYGLTDYLEDSRQAVEVEAHTDFIEAMHLAGATTVMYPLWSPIGLGLGTLANLVYLLRFYSELPVFSGDRRSVSQSSRKAMLWIRNATADDIIAYIARSPIPKQARSDMIAEMEQYVAASVSPTKDPNAHITLSSAQAGQMLTGGSNAATPQGRQRPSLPPLSIPQSNNVSNGFTTPQGTNRTTGRGLGASETDESGIAGTLGNRIGGDRKFFTHFLNWGFYAISGHGGNVHHPDLATDIAASKQPAKKKTPKKGAKPKANEDNNEEDDEINPEFEVAMLKMEGKLEEAKLLESVIRRRNKEERTRKIEKAKYLMAKAGRGIMDGLEVIDKALLVQDSDSVSVSDDEDDEETRKRIAYKKTQAALKSPQKKGSETTVNTATFDKMARVKFAFGSHSQNDLSDPQQALAALSPESKYHYGKVVQPDMSPREQMALMAVEKDYQRKIAAGLTEIGATNDMGTDQGNAVADKLGLSAGLSSSDTAGKKSWIDYQREKEAKRIALLKQKEEEMAVKRKKEEGKVQQKLALSIAHQRKVLADAENMLDDEETDATAGPGKKYKPKRKGNDDDSDIESEDSEGLTGFALLAKKKAKLLTDSVVGLSHEVRSYKVAAKAAQDMLAKLPAHSKAPKKDGSNAESGVCVVC